jgi:hypothetical protein
MYTIICDGCGKDVCEGTEYSGWNDKAYLEDVALEDLWIIRDDENYCPDCWEWDEEDTGEERVKIGKKGNFKSSFKDGHDMILESLVSKMIRDQHITINQEKLLSILSDAREIDMEVRRQDLKKYFKRGENNFKRGYRPVTFEEFYKQEK